MRKRSPWAWVPTLYFAEGLPNVIVAELSVLMYQQLGLSNTETAFYTSWFYLPWVIKPLWSPFVELLKTKRWWILAMEALLGAAFGGVAFTIPTAFWLQGTICFFWLLAFSSATHDIAADGFYMIGLDEHEQAWFVGIRNTFYRIASIFSKGLLVWLAGALQVMFRGQISYSWSVVFYAVLGIFIALYLYHHFILPKAEAEVSAVKKSPREIANGVVETVVTFFKKPYIITAVLFMLLYRFPEALLSKISLLFLRDFRHSGGLGLSPQEFSLVYGTVGVIGLLGGGIIGGMLASRDGLKRWLWPMVAAITVPDAVYIYMSYAMPTNLLLINICVFIEQFGYGFGFTAYTLYLIYFSQGKYKTSHYALCTGFMAASMMIPGMFSGWLQDSMGYQHFFILVMAACLVTFLVSALIKFDPDFGKRKAEESDEE
ncbi:MAG: MFS transporter [Prevotella sp.]|nr:MFS transporter [Prevotella sp.]